MITASVTKELKAKKIRSNQARFMKKDPSKSIINKSMNKNRYLRFRSRENVLCYKKAKILNNSLNKNAKKTYFEKKLQKTDLWVGNSLKVRSVNVTSEAQIKNFFIS